MTYGTAILKSDTRKIRWILDGKMLVGFAGSTADAFSLLERFETKAKNFPGNLPPSALLYGEAQGRVVVTVRTEKQLARLKERAARLNIRAAWIGTVGGPNLRIAQGPATLPPAHAQLCV